MEDIPALGISWELGESKTIRVHWSVYVYFLDSLFFIIVFKGDEENKQILKYIYFSIMYSSFNLKCTCICLL